MSEVWKPVEGFLGIYEVSDFGNVRSLPRIVKCGSKRGGSFSRRTPGKVLEPHFIDGTPYIQLRLRTQIKDSTFSIRRLVWTHFKGPIESHQKIFTTDGSCRLASLYLGLRKDVSPQGRSQPQLAQTNGHAAARRPPLIPATIFSTALYGMVKPSTSVQAEPAETVDG
jgi:hypothetical protein